MNEKERMTIMRALVGLSEEVTRAEGMLYAPFPESEVKGVPCPADNLLAIIEDINSLTERLAKINATLLRIG